MARAGEGETRGLRTHVFPPPRRDEAKKGSEVGERGRIRTLRLLADFLLFERVFIEGFTCEMISSGKCFKGLTFFFLFIWL